MNRKAQLELPAIVPMFLAIGGMVLVFLVLFLLISSIKGCTRESVSSKPTEMLKVDMNYALMQFLRSTAEVDGRTLPISELVGLVGKEVNEGVACSGEAGGPSCQILVNYAHALFDSLFEKKGRPDWDLELLFYEWQQRPFPSEPLEVNMLLEQGRLEAGQWELGQRVRFNFLSEEVSTPAEIVTIPLPELNQQVSVHLSRGAKQ